MDYSLLVGIHDVDRAEQEEMEVEERAEDEECENDGLGGNLLCSYGTPPDSPGNLLSFPRFFGPGEFDPSVDVYAMKSHESKWRPRLPCPPLSPMLPPSGPLFRCSSGLTASSGLFLPQVLLSHLLVPVALASRALGSFSVRPAFASLLVPDV